VINVEYLVVEPLQCALGNGDEPNWNFQVGEHRRRLREMSEVIQVLLDIVPPTSAPKCRYQANGGIGLNHRTPPFAALPVSSRRLARISCLCSHGGVTGVPQVSIPGAAVNGLPIGLSIVGGRGSDATLVAVARALAVPREDQHTMRQHLGP
jgi:amidase